MEKEVPDVNLVVTDNELEVILDEPPVALLVAEIENE